MLDKLNLIDKQTKILDYGCAVGFLIGGFYKYGFQNVFGYDISQWALDKAKKNNIQIVDVLKKQNFDIGIFLDVLEHMIDNEISNVLVNNNFDKIIVRIPCSVEENKKEFFLDVSKKDKTHINCKTETEWVKFFKQYNYNVCLKLNLYNIYNSKGCFCAIIIKK